MKGCGLCWTEAELALLDGDPALVPDKVVWQFAWEVEDHFEPEEYGPAWRRLGYRVIGLLDDDPDSRLTMGLTWAGWQDWPEAERTALYEQVTDVVLRAAADENRLRDLGELLQAAAQLDQSLTPWLRLADTLPDEVVEHLAEEWSDVNSANSTFGTWLRWTGPTPQEEVEEWLSTR
ncbi:nucleoside-diphosphate sugar epimerase/dehydratase [Lentzea sp. NPDC058436]|uniref:nucleoside-diphosphate sugar epimerase/dehydratase n=1 Tax=Lentzea sp. NPDC058436 TaxID=3346499 RepID=UPI0036634E96